MDKRVIIDAIRRMAEVDGGIAPGRERFERETGIRESKWLGVYWVKWSDAVREAGYEPRRFQTAHPDEQILLKLASLVRKKGRFPTAAEIRLEKRIDPDFPWNSVIVRLGTKAVLIERLSGFCRKRQDFADVADILPSYSETVPSGFRKKKSRQTSDGSVYLIQGGRFYKIGFTNDMGRRTYDLRIQLPEQVKLIHEIKTDDPKGIEQYWHRRFADRRANGEWFSLTQEDVAAFRRRKFM